MREQQHGGGGAVGRSHHLDGGGGERPVRQLDRERGAVDGGNRPQLASARLQAKHVTMLMRWMLLQMLQEDLKTQGAVSSSDKTVIFIACDQLAHCAAKQARIVDTPMTEGQLINIQTLIDSIRATTLALQTTRHGLSV